MPERDPADLAAQLAGKARDDATAVREFANNSQISDILEEDGGVKVPISGDQLDELTRYAVPLRYEDLLDAEPLNRDAALSSVNEVGKWAAAELHPSG